MRWHDGYIGCPGFLDSPKSAAFSLARGCSNDDDHRGSVTSGREGASMSKRLRNVPPSLTLPGVPPMTSDGERRPAGSHHSARRLLRVPPTRRALAGTTLMVVLLLART